MIIFGNYSLDILSNGYNKIDNLKLLYNYIIILYEDDIFLIIFDLLEIIFV